MERYTYKYENHQSIQWWLIFLLVVNVIVHHDLLWCLLTKLHGIQCIHHPAQGWITHLMYDGIIFSSYSLVCHETIKCVLAIQYFETWNYWKLEACWANHNYLWKLSPKSNGLDRDDKSGHFFFGWFLQHTIKRIFWSTLSTFAPRWS